jgi:hypothetical protein
LTSAFVSQMTSEEDRDNVGHKLGGPLRCTNDELIKNGEGTGLDLPLAGSLDLMEKRRGTSTFPAEYNVEPKSV